MVEQQEKRAAWQDSKGAVKPRLKTGCGCCTKGKICTGAENVFISIYSDAVHAPTPSQCH